jgi:hypothetical protein
MSRSILDQNGIILLDGNEPCDEIIISPMFMWELFNNIGSPIEKQLIQYLKKINNKIVVTFKSIISEATEMQSSERPTFNELINHQNTQAIRHWLNDRDPSLSYMRDKLSPGFTSDSFKLMIDELAKNSWLPVLEKEFEKFTTPKDITSARSKFEAESKEVSEDLCMKAFNVCYKVLTCKGLSQKEAILFLKQPSIFYNRMFGIVTIHMYRSSQAEKGFPSKIVANDIKDVDYLFLAHHAESIIGNDKFMRHTFAHLRKSYEILNNMETGL